MFIATFILSMNHVLWTVDNGPGLLIGFVNQVRVLFEGAGAVDARSAAPGPQSFDRLAR